MLPWSVMPIAGWPSAAAAATSSSTRAAPSSIEYSVCRWRWVNESATTSCLLAVDVAPRSDVIRRTVVVSSDATRRSLGHDRHRARRAAHARPTALDEATPETETAVGAVAGQGDAHRHDGEAAARRGAVAAPLDDAQPTSGLTEIYAAAAVDELSDGLSPDLAGRSCAGFALPFANGTPTDAELRVAQAQLVELAATGSFARHPGHAVRRSSWPPSSCSSRSAAARASSRRALDASAPPRRRQSPRRRTSEAARRRGSTRSRLARARITSGIGQRAAAAASRGTQHLGRRQRPVPADRGRNGPGVGRVVEGDRLPGHEGHVAEPIGGVGLTAGPNHPSSTDLLDGAPPRPRRRGASVAASSSVGGARPGRACSHRNRPSPDWRATRSSTRRRRA